MSLMEQQSACFAGTQSACFARGGGGIKELAQCLVLSKFDRLSSPPPAFPIVNELSGYHFDRVGPYIGIESPSFVAPPWLSMAYFERHYNNPPPPDYSDYTTSLAFGPLWFADIDGGYLTNPDHWLQTMVHKSVWPALPGNFTGQKNFGAECQVSFWFNAQRPNGTLHLIGVPGVPYDGNSQARTVALKNRHQFNRSSFGFRASAEVWANKSTHVHGWDDFSNGIVAYYTWESVTKITDLGTRTSPIPANTWIEMPLPNSASGGTFPNGFVGRVIFDVHFETFTEWKARTGVTDRIPLTNP